MFVRFPFLSLSLAFAAGILLQHFFSIGLAYQLSGFTVLIILTLISYFGKSEKPYLHLVLIALFCLMGGIRFSIWQTGHLDKPYLSYLPIKQVDIHGTINSLQRTYRLKAILNLKQIRRDSVTADVDGKIVVYFPPDFTIDLSPGQVMSIQNISLDPLPEPRNPGQFDYARYLRWRGIVAQCNIENKNQVVVTGGSPGFSLENSIFAPVRTFLIARMERYFAPSAFNFLRALLFGQREGLEDDVVENFQNAGVMHVLAISGLHVGFVALIFYVALSFLPLYFKYRNILIILMLLFYMFLTGCHPSVVRATIMAIILLLSINLERPASIYNSIFAAALIILLFAPQQLFWVGFQFSFIAVLSIIYFYEKLSVARNWLLNLIENKRIRTLVDKAILIPFLVSFSAQVGTLPLTMHYFHKLSVISFLLNIMVIPFIGLIVIMGFLFFFVILVNHAFAVLYSEFLEALIRLLINSVEAAAHSPAAFFYIPKFSLMGILLYGTLLFLLFNFRNRIFRKAAIALSLFLMLLMMTQTLVASRAFNLVIMDVGQGDSAFLLTPQKKSILIDTGPANQHTSAARNAILPVLNHFNTSTVNRLFISHPHLDHMGGTFDMLKYIDVDSAYLPYLTVSYKWNDSLMHVLDKKAIPYRVLHLGDKVVIDKETHVYVLGPDPRFSNITGTTGQDLNNISLVLLIKFREHTLLFPGDAERKAENFLVLWDSLLKTDFLKVGHHGSKTSTTDDFYSLVDPRYASISVGEGNRFGHPSASVIRRLTSGGTRVFRTDTEGAIWLQIRDGKWKQIDWH